LNHEETPSDEEKKLVIDGDWKEQVKQEKEKLKTESKPEAPAGASTSTDSDSAQEKPATAGSNFPPPDFMMLVSMLATQAFAAMGQIPDPQTGKAEVNHDIAKHMIDLLAVLEKKTEGNLSSQETMALENLLHELRMVFVSIK